MNHNTIYQLFASTHQPEPNIQHEAEIAIRKYEQQPGFLPIVLQLAATDEVDLKTRQAAAIYFKNRVQKCWDVIKEDISPQCMTIHFKDKEAIRRSILQALYTSPPLIQAPLASSLYSILNVDFPSEWPTFIQEVSQYLASHENSSMVRVGLVALREFVKVYQYKSVERRGPLKQVIELTFPTMLLMCQNLMQINYAAQEATGMLILCLKIYYASIRVELPSFLQDFSSSLSPWIALFLQIVDQKLPYSSALAKANNVGVEQLELRWVLKKWAYLCLNHLFSKYGNPSLQPADPSFAASFVEHIAPNIVETYLQQLNDYISYYPDQAQKEEQASVAAESQKACLSLTAAFFDDAIKHKVTWQLLKPHVDVLISQFLFRQVCFSPADEHLWSEPIEYIHRELDVKAQDNNINLLVDLANFRRKYTFLNILNFIQNVMNEQSAITEDQQRNGYLKDGALRMFGSLAPVILSSDESSDIMEQIESFFQSHVLPAFRSRFPYLRARACQLLYQFDIFNFTSEENLATMYQYVLSCLKDNELPVKVHAALALQTLARYEYIQQLMIGPQLPLIIQEILALCQEIEIDPLPAVLQDLVETFTVQLAPFAVELCTQLRDMYLRNIEELIQHHHYRQMQQNNHLFSSPHCEDDEDELADSGVVVGGVGVVVAQSSDDVVDTWSTRATAAATGLLKTMCTLFLSFNQNTETFSPELLMQLESIIAPAISNTLSCSNSTSTTDDNNGGGNVTNAATTGPVAACLVDLHGDLFDLVDACTFSINRAITPTMWALFADCIYPAFKSEQVHLDMNDLHSALENYLMYGKEVVAANEQVRNMLFDMIAVTMKTEDGSDTVAVIEESERTCACKLMQTILLHYRSDRTMDMCVVPFLTMVLPYITSSQMKSLEFKIHCLEVVISAMYYNPLPTLHFLEKHQLSQGFFNLWFTILDKFSRVHDKKLVILTLCSLLMIPNDNIPVSLQAAWPHLVAHIAEVFQTLPEAFEKREQLLKEGEENTEDDDDDDEEDREAVDETVEEGTDDQTAENVDEDDDVVEDEDAEYLEFLAQRAHRNGDKQEKFTLNQTKGQLEDEQESLQEDTAYQSPLEDTDPYICFEQTLKSVQQQNPSLYLHITGALTEEQQNMVMSIINLAEQQRQTE